MSRKLTEARAGFDWAADNCKRPPSQRAATNRGLPADRLRAIFPSDRDRARTLRDGLPNGWRHTLDATRYGEYRPPFITAILLQRVAEFTATEEGEPAMFDSVQSLREQMHHVGLRALALATEKLDKRRRIRLVRNLSEQSRRTILDTNANEADVLVREVARDAFVRLADSEPDLTARADALGMFMLAFAYAADSDRPRQAEITALLIGRERNRFLDFATAAQRSTRKDAISLVRTFVEEQLW